MVTITTVAGGGRVKEIQLNTVLNCLTWETQVTLASIKK